jgi:glycosyltransferase involved in cell wall biosynthesis
VTVDAPAKSPTPPRVSVVMAVYNGMRFAPAAIDSVLAQTFRDFELVIIDDGSTDETPVLLDAYAKRDLRVRVIHQTNAGVSKAGNNGVSLARAPLVARMDSDDICAPDRLAKQVAFMDAHPEVVLLGGWYRLIDVDSEFLTLQGPPADNESLQMQCLCGTTPICHPLCMFRRDAFFKAGRYDETFPCALDIDLYLRLGEVGKMAALPDILLDYRQHAGSISESKQTLQLKYMRLACENAWKRRGLSDVEFGTNEPWRADGSKKSLLEQHLRFGWWAWNSGNNRAARRYGRRAVGVSPLDLRGWKLWACGVLKHSPQATAS